MLRSLYSGISGLRQHQQGMDVVGNNIANVNTTGFKSSRVIFEDLFSQTLSGARAPADNTGGINAKQIGTGVGLASVDNIFTEGTPENTGVVTDLAIEGEGFFVVRGQGENEDYYTRAGNFSFDKNGNMVNPSGYIVQGWMADPETGELQTDTDAVDLQLSEAHKNLAPQQTTETSLAGNLDTRAEPSILEYQRLLTHADGNANLSSLYDANGSSLDLSDDEPVIIKANATNVTDMGKLYNSYGVDIGLNDEDTVEVSIGTSSATFEYDTDGNSTVTSTFTTFGDLISSINSNTSLGTISASSTSDGGIQIKYTGAETLNFTSNNSMLRGMLQDLNGSYDGATKSTDSFVYQRELIEGIDFNTIDELVNDINESIKYNVSSGFEANFIPSDSTANATNAGKIQYLNYSASSTYSSSTTYAISGFEIDKAYSGSIFENNIDTFDDLTTAAGSVEYSNIFLQNAVGEDKLTDLFSSSGQDLGITASSTIEMSARINGEDPNPEGDPSAVNGDATISDLMATLETYLDLDNTSGSVKIQDGKIIVTGEKGESNNIDFIDLTASGVTNNNFNSYMAYSTLQSASGGQLVTGQTIYDSLGNPHVVNYNFTIEKANERIWRLDLDVEETDSSIAFDGIADNVYVKFGTDGSLESIYHGSDPNDVNPISELTYTLTTNSGAENISNVKLNLGTLGENDGMTTSAAESSIKKTDQNGFARGELDRISINDAGEMIGAYTNGELKTLGQIGVATFTNRDGLLKVGDTMFSTTPNSGEAAIGRANTGGRGIIKSGYVENSNVDLAKEFVDMIKMQRGYQANSRVITTSDEMLQELMNLKR